MLLFAPISTGEPISTAVLTILSAIASIFTGGMAALTKNAINQLRDAISWVADNLSRVAGRIARWVDSAMRGLAYVWRNIIRPVLLHIQQIFDRVRRLIDRVLKPYLDFMERIRRQILMIYNLYFRPIIQLIESLRKMLAILRLAHIKFADKLDAQLARLEAKISWPVQEALRRTSVTGRWINVLLTAKMLLQQPILVNSLVAYDGAWINHFYNAQSKPLTPAEKAELYAERPEVTPEMAAQQVRDYFTTGGGPIALEIQDALAYVRQHLGA